MKAMPVVPRIAIDCGSKHIRAIADNEDGVVFSTRSVLVRKVVSGEIVLIGDAAADHPVQAGEELIKPVQDGVMVDYQGAVALFRHAVSSALSWWQIFKPRVVVAESLSLSTAVSQAMAEAVQEAGGGAVFMTPVPTLTALGSGVVPHESTGSLVLDIGHSTTEAAVIARGSIAVSKVAIVGGSDLRRAIEDYVHQRYNMTIDESVSEKILHTIGTALQRDTTQSHTFYANTLDTDETRSVTISSNEVAEALSDPLQRVVKVVSDLIKETPTTLLSDIATDGVRVAGGVGSLNHIDTYISRELSLPVQVTEAPQHSVIRGGGKALGYLSTYDKLIPQANV